MAHLKCCIVEFKAENNCLAHALIAKARSDNDPNYKAYHQGWKLRHVVEHLIQTTGIDLRNGGRIPELIRFQEQYRILVLGGLKCEDMVFDGQVESGKRINLLYDEVSRLYHVITSLTGALAKEYLCRGCSKGYTLHAIQKCHQTCIDCMSIPP